VCQRCKRLHDHRDPRRPSYEPSVSHTQAVLVSQSNPTLPVLNLPQKCAAGR
jgi:hypothetical protein